MDESSMTLSVYTAFADLDLLYGEEDQGAEPDPAPAAPADAVEPETVDAFNAQILAGLVSP